MNLISLIFGLILIEVVSHPSYAETHTDSETDITLNPGPKSEKEAKFLFEESFRNLQFDPADSARNLQRLLARYPNFPKKKEAKIALANALFNLKEYKAAKPYFRELLLDTTDAGERETARLKIAEIDWALDDATAALSSLHEILKNTKPDSNITIEALLFRSKIYSLTNHLKDSQADYDAAVTQSKNRSNLASNELIAWTLLRTRNCENEQDFNAIKLCYKNILRRSQVDEESFLIQCKSQKIGFEQFLKNSKLDKAEKKKLTEDWALFLEESNCTQNG